MKTNSLLLILGGIILFPILGISQQKSLSMDEAIQTAIQNNPGLRSVALEVDFQKQFKGTSTEIPKTNVMFMGAANVTNTVA